MHEKPSDLYATSSKSQTYNDWSSSLSKPPVKTVYYGESPGYTNGGVTNYVVTNDRVLVEGSNNPGQYVVVSDENVHSVPRTNTTYQYISPASVGHSISQPSSTTREYIYM